MMLREVILYEVFYCSQNTHFQIYENTLVKMKNFTRIIVFHVEVMSRIDTDRWRVRPPAINAPN